MDTNRLRASLLAVTAAVAVAVSGTFAWQNMNQIATNEAEKASNPGGRLHDDFSGWEDGGTKDIYVENFGNQVIYARVRLDEYMEIGEGAGLRSGEEGFDSKVATPLVENAKIDQASTWLTHIPGSDADPFHDYWTWTMGGQTVYMPTFNKNKDSLKADVNGTLAGTDPTDDIFYDDFVAYKVGDTKIAAEYEDADADTTDECGPQGGPGGTGVVDVNYTETADVTHTAKETLNGTVITMAEYVALSDAEKTALNAWVYDADGWAYWSQPIQPDTATGLLLDQISLTKRPSGAWYYAINAVAQFVTEDDLGRLNNTGFYTVEAEKPSDDALNLLEFIGVNRGSYTVDILNAENASVTGTTVEIKPGGEATFSLNITSSPVGYTPSGSWSWSSGNTSTATVTASGMNNTSVTVAVPSGATIGNETIITATNGSLTASFTVKAEKVTYSVAVTPKTATIYPGKTQDFSATVTASDGSTVDQTVTWSVTGGVTGTAFSGSTLTVAAAETASTLTVTATAAVDNSVTDTATVTVGVPTYTVDILDSAATPASVKGTTVNIAPGGSATFSLSISSTPEGYTPSGNWSWTSADTSTATVTPSGTNNTSVTVAVPSTATVGNTTTITATNGDLSAYFTVKANEDIAAITAKINSMEPGLTDTVTMSGVEWYVLAKDTVTGTDGKDHYAALLLSKNVLEKRRFDNGSSQWSDSSCEMRTYLNGTFLTSHSTVSTKAVEVTIQTRSAYDATTSDGGVSNKVFLLSEADVFGTSNKGADTSPQSWEYTYNGAQLDCFKTQENRIAYLDGSAQWWWLRSPANTTKEVARVTAAGAVSYDYYDGTTGGVRPAFWYNLDA